MDDLTFSASVLERLPLADGVWRVLGYVMDDRLLDGIWQRHRGRCYEQTLKFPTLAGLITEALFQHDGSGRQAFERGQEAEILPVSIGSAYEKLGNLPLPVSEALLGEGTARLHGLLPLNPAIALFPLPRCWDEFDVFGADGKAIKHVK